MVLNFLEKNITPPPSSQVTGIFQSILYATGQKSLFCLQFSHFVPREPSFCIIFFNEYNKL